MTDEAWSDQVAKIVRECEEYWTSCLMSRSTIDELLVELESHCDGARQHGKTPKIAIRSAREWAVDQADDCRVSPSWSYGVLTLTALLMLTGTLFVIAQHLKHASSTIPVGLDDVVLVGLLISAVRLHLSPKLRFLFFSHTDRIARVSRRTWWLLSASSVAGAVYFVLGAGDRPALFQWSWPYSAALLLVTVPIVAFYIRRDPTRRAASGPHPAYAPFFARADAATLEQQRKTNRLILACGLCSVCCFTLGYALTPGAHGMSGTLLAASIYWLAYLLHDRFRLDG